MGEFPALKASEKWWQVRDDGRTSSLTPYPGMLTCNQQLCPLSHFAVFLAIQFPQRTGQEEMGLSWEPWFFQREEGITRSHFKFLWRVSGQLIPSPDSGAITSGCPPYFCTRNQSSQSAVKFGWKEKMFLNLFFFFSSPVRQRLRREGGLGGRRRERENFWMINTFNCTCASAEGWSKEAGERWDPQIINIKDERTSEVTC